MLNLALAAFAGGIISGLIGWAESSEPFQPRKFLKTALASLVAAAGFAAGAPDGPVPLAAILGAFLAGAGVDVLANRSLGYLRKS